MNTKDVKMLASQRQYTGFEVDLTFVSEISSWLTVEQVFRKDLEGRYKFIRRIRILKQM